MLGSGEGVNWVVYGTSESSQVTAMCLDDVDGLHLSEVVMVQPGEFNAADCQSGKIVTRSVSFDAAVVVATAIGQTNLKRRQSLVDNPVQPRTTSQIEHILGHTSLVRPA